MRGKRAWAGAAVRRDPRCCLGREASAPARALGGAGCAGHMSQRPASPTIADVLHHMYAASAEPLRFPARLAGLLGMEIEHLRALYDRPAPHPASPAFTAEVLAVARHVGCDPDVLAELLAEWTPAGGQPSGEARA